MNTEANRFLFDVSDSETNKEPGEIYEYMALESSKDKHIFISLKTSQTDVTGRISKTSGKINSALGHTHAPKSLTSSRNTVILHAPNSSVCNLRDLTKS